MIRFAGDSGDGMQITGDRFTDESALVRQRPVDLPELPGRDPGAGGHPRRRLRLPDPHLRPRDPHAGRRAERARGDEPGGLEGQRRRPADGRHPRHQLGRVRRAGPRQGGLRDQPPRGRQPVGFRVYEIPMTSLTLEACKPTGAKPRDAERSKNFFALGLVSWLYHRPDRRDRGLDRQALRPGPGRRRGEHARLPGRLQLRRDGGDLRVLLRDRPGRARLRAPTPTSPATPPSPGGCSPPPSSPSCRCSSAPTRSRRPRTSCTSCPSTRTSACAPSRPRTRSPASAPPSEPPSAAPSGSRPRAGPGST